MLLLFLCVTGAEQAAYRVIESRQVNWQYRGKTSRNTVGQTGVISFHSTEGQSACRFNSIWKSCMKSGGSVKFAYVSKVKNLWLSGSSACRAAGATEMVITELSVCPVSALIKCRADQLLSSVFPSWVEEITNDEWLNLGNPKPGAQNYSHSSQFIEPCGPAMVVLQPVSVNSTMRREGGERWITPQTHERWSGFAVPLRNAPPVVPCPVSSSLLRSTLRNMREFKEERSGNSQTC